MLKRTTPLAIAVAALAVAGGFAMAQESPQEPDPALGTLSRIVNPFVPPVQAAPEIVLGRSAEASGRIPDASRTEVFTTSDPVHIGLVEPPPDGTSVAVEIIEPGDRVVWRSRTTEPPGEDEVSFRIDPGKLAPGPYLVRVSVGGTAWIVRPVRVSNGRGGD